MQYTLMLWQADHINFNRLLKLLERELEVLHRTGSPDYQLMLDIMYYMTHYSDVLHHPKEDLLFARIKAHDEKLGPTIDELRVQHTQLRHEGEAMVRALSDVLNGSIALRDRVEASARAYVSGLRAHMRIEEREILPRAAGLLSDSDWTEIDAAIASFDDPVFGSKVHERYLALREEIDRHAGGSRAMAP